MFRYAKKKEDALHTHKNPSLLRIPTNELLCTAGSSPLFLQARQHTLTRANMPARRQEAVLWVTADPTRIFVYTSPQDPNTASTLGGIVLALFIHRLHSQSNRLFIIFILVWAFCPGEQGAYLTKWKNCHMSALFNTENKECEGIERFGGREVITKPHLAGATLTALFVIFQLVSPLFA